MVNKLTNEKRKILNIGSIFFIIFFALILFFLRAYKFHMELWNLMVFLAPLLIAILLQIRVSVDDFFYRKNGIINRIFNASYMLILIFIVFVIIYLEFRISEDIFS